MSITKKKVVLAMSGGVDSSVAAALLLRAGYDVMGVFMRLGTPDGVESHEAVACETSGKNKQGCCSVLDAADARRVAAALEIPLYVLNFQDDFGRVIDYFVAEYNRGRTPNPCVRCNDWLKFGKLAKYAEAVGADFVASGHYARVGVDPLGGEAALLRGIDHRKDQSYVLFGMSRAALAHTLLPIGEYEKPAVREIARELKLPVYNKPDSQEICFVPDQDYAALVKRRSPETFRSGELVDPSGIAIGAHEGHQHFTIGQRKGLGVAFGHRMYVVDIDPQTNRVTVGEKEALMKRSLVAHQINVLSARFAREGDTVRCAAKIRYNHPPQAATATITAGDEVTVRFEEPQSAITPGQAVVLYDGDVVLGGGWIDDALEAMFRRNLLIFHSGALGDFVVTWPIAMAAARLYAQSRIIYVTSGEKGALAERLLRVDSTDVEGGWSELYSESPNLSEKTWKLLDGAHVALSFVSSPDDRWSENFQKLAPEARLVHLHTKEPESAPPRHVTDYLLEQLKPTPALYSATTQMLKWVRDNGVGTHIAKKDAPVVIHPGSGAPRKCWPADRFIELAEKLRADGTPVQFVLGEVEREQWAADRVDRLRAVADLAQPKTYTELYGLIAQSRAFVGNDTGPTHLAAICGVPTVAIFGSDPTRWQPVGPRLTVVQGNTIDDVTTADVYSAIQ